jgi:hypothetical protein
VLLRARSVLERKGTSVSAVGIQPQIQKVFDIMQALPAATVFRNTAELDEYLTEMQRRIVRGR